MDDFAAFHASKNIPALTSVKVGDYVSAKFTADNAWYVQPRSTCLTSYTDLLPSILISSSGGFSGTEHESFHLTTTRQSTSPSSTTATRNRYRSPACDPSTPPASQRLSSSLPKPSRAGSPLWISLKLTQRPWTIFERPWRDLY